MSDRATPLLDLSTLVARPAIAIDGTRYSMRSPAELSIVESHRFALLADRANAAQRPGGDVAEFELAIDEIATGVLVDVPPKVFAKLTGAQKLQVAEVFTGLLLRTRLRAAGAIDQAMGHPLTGVRSSPGSSGSSAAPPATGWRARLSQLFALT